MKVLKWLGHVERTSEGELIKRVNKSVWRVEGAYVRKKMHMLHNNGHLSHKYDTS